MFWYLPAASLVCMLFAVFFKKTKATLPAAIVGAILAAPFGLYFTKSPAAIFQLFGGGSVIAAILTAGFSQQARRWAKWGFAAQALCTMGIVITVVIRISS